MKRVVLSIHVILKLQGLSELNDLRSPVYTTGEKSFSLSLEGPVMTF